MEAGQNAIAVNVQPHTAEQLGENRAAWGGNSPRENSIETPEYIDRR